MPKYTSVNTSSTHSATEKTSATLEPTDVDGESVSALFVATLDCIRDSAAQGIRKTSEFLGKSWLILFLGLLPQLNDRSN